MNAADRRRAAGDTTADWLYRLSAGSLIALIFLCLAWELWLAPLRPGGSWLVLKTLPLLAPLFGILRRRRYTYQWSSMLVLAYFIEGVVRGYSETGPSAWLAHAETGLALLFFCSAVAYARATAGIKKIN
ncbi:MAG: DUF2069 domain-containing protein [Burkholderiales bacterium]|nr:DUF2069 domain-containing protein [Burkholderiales bacterium]